MLFSNWAPLHDLCVLVRDGVAESLPDKLAVLVVTSLDVGIIGAGRAGRSIARALSMRGHNATLHGGRSGYPTESVIVICVPDAAIPDVVSRLRPAIPGDCLVVHVSGATSVEVLEPFARRGVLTAVAHPLMSLPDELIGAELLQDAPVAVTAADPTARIYARWLALAWGGRPFDLADDVRVAYHAAAVWSAGHVATCIAAARQLLAGTGVDPSVLEKLAVSSVRNALRDGSAAITGPAVRRDIETMARHASVMPPELKAAYAALSDLAAGMREPTA